VSLAASLKELVEATAGPAELAALEAAAASPSAKLLAEYTAVARRVGKAAARLPRRELHGLTLDGRGVDELVRLWLLVTAAGRRDDAAMLELVGECWRRGDNRERHAVLRALPLLPRPEQYVSLAVDACRSSVQTLFEAIACENPFPSRHFPQSALNQLVLKALFTQVALARIVGLEGRLNPELNRMAEGYACERRAAGRSVPSDIGVLL